MSFSADQSFLKSLLCAPDAQSVCRTVASKIGESLGASSVAIFLDRPVSFVTQWAVPDVVQDDAALLKVLEAFFAHFREASSFEAITAESKLSFTQLREDYAALQIESFISVRFLTKTCCLVCAWWQCLPKPILQMLSLG